MEKEIEFKCKFQYLIQAFCSESGIVQLGIVKDIFKKLGADTNVSNSSIKNWMAGRNKGYKNYFKGITINQSHDDAFVEYFVESYGTRFTRIQNNLKKYEKEYSLIDFKAGNADEFFVSVLNQFKKIVDLPNEKNTESIEQNKDSLLDCTVDEETILKEELISKKMLNIFEKAFCDCHIEEFISLNIYKGIKQNLLSWVDRFIETTEFDIINSLKEYHTEIMYKLISQFINHLCNYKKYFLENSYRISNSKLKKSTDNFRLECSGDVEETLEYYRQRISDKLIEIHNISASSMDYLNID